MPRKQLPVYSPVTVGSVDAAFSASVSGGAAARARAEARVREAYAPRDLLLVDSGTSALTLALLAVRRGAEEQGRPACIALPAYGCFDLATAAVGAGVRVALYDLDPGTLGPAWPSLEQALAQGVAAVVVAHLYGVPVDVARVARMASAAGAVVVDDAAQGVGASIAGRPVGSLGSLGVLSFGRGKGRTGGGGGALLANDEAGVSLLARVRGDVGAAGRGVKPAMLLKAQWLLGRPSVYWIPASVPFFGLGETPYHAPHRPTAMPASCAAALDAVWDASMREVDARRRAATAWRSRDATRGWRFPESDAPEAVRGELRLAALVPPDETARDAVERLGGGAMPGYPMTLARLPALADRLDGAISYPGADALAHRLVTLPCHRYVVA